MEEGGSLGFVMAKYIWVVLAIIIIFIGGLIFFVFPGNSCGDGTAYGECSTAKPYYCLQGEFVERASFCGCSGNFSEVGEECFFEYKKNPQNVSLTYFFKDEIKEINFIVYDSGYDYLRNVDRAINLEEDFSRDDFKIKIIENEIQRELLLPLVKEIQNLGKTKKEQAEIAISLVQNIKYTSTSNLSLLKQALFYRYPYEVLYEEEGICGEKSDLLAFLLKELGYGVSIFYFPEVNHEAVGIKCSFYKDFRDTGYCYIETTGSSEINDYGVLQGLGSAENFEIIEISDGDKF